MTTPNRDDDNQTPQSTTPLLLQTFHTDGYLLLPSLLSSPPFISQLRTECLDIFHAVLDWLYVAGAAEFAESCRRRIDDDDSSGSKKVRYEYPIQLGLKNGYQELVMRSPGRYELALLLEDRYDHDDDDTNSNDGQNISENNDHGGAQHQVGAAATNDTNARHEGMTTSAAALQKEDCCCYNGKRLMTVDMIERAKRQFITANYNNCERGKNYCGEEMMTRCSVNETTAVIAASSSSSSKRSSKSSCLPQSSCLQQLLRWIKQYEAKSNDAVAKVNDRKYNGSSINSEKNDNIDDDTSNEMHEEQTEENVDEMNFTSFMKLVSAIFPPPATTNTTSTTTCCTHDNNNHHLNNDEYYLCNLSLLISTPGSPTQSWHADGGHTSLTTHHPCHVFNVFIPLVDVPLSMGPTELRPGTHVYTRDLARMMLLAKAKKRLREAVVPELRRGDALLFDYRILHRGRANLSDGVVVCERNADDDNDADDDEEEHYVEEVSRDRDDGDDIRTSNKRHNKSGRDRPVLVLTFARRWKGMRMASVKRGEDMMCKNTME
eukprot:scaffold19276_cov82-Skeletonema_dohrnii-CCMP3373.AAC.4